MTTTIDCAAEMRRIIDQHTADGPYVPRVAAAELVEKLRATAPELLAAWLDTQAEQFIWQAINDRDRSRRSFTARRARSWAFAAAAGSFSSGETGALSGFLNMPFTVEDGSRRRLAELSRDDLLHVAADYEQRANENAMKAAFMRALAKKVRNGVVADHFTEEQLSTMFESLS